MAYSAYMLVSKKRDLDATREEVVVQWSEHRLVTSEVAGSSPVNLDSFLDSKSMEL